MSKLVGKQDLLFLGIALAGCFGAGSNEHARQASSVTIYDMRLDCYYHRLVDGGTVIDKRPAFINNEDAAYRAVIGGPMHNAQLPANTVSRFLNNELSATTDDLDSFRSLDTISTNLYVAYWERLGARIGIRKGNTIVWNDGAIEPITVPAWAQETVTW